MNAVEIEKAISKLAEQPFDPQEFSYLFLEAFDNKETTIKHHDNVSTIEGADNTQQKDNGGA